MRWLRGQHHSCLYGPASYHVGKATQAISQVQHYLEELSRLQPCGVQRALTLGHSQYAFILIGTTAEIMRKCDSEVKQLQCRKLAPPGISIIPYDELFRTFQKTAAPVMVLNVLRPSYTPQIPYLSPQRFFGMIDPFDGSNEAVLKLWTTTGLARIESGNHHIVFGIPRRLWPIGNNKLQEYYEYELIAKVGREHFDFVHADLEQAAGGIFPMIATELMGNLDAEAGTWRKAIITATTRSGERRYAMFDDWWLSFYEATDSSEAMATLSLAPRSPLNSHQNSTGKTQGTGRQLPHFADVTRSDQYGRQTEFAALVEAVIRKLQWPVRPELFHRAETDPR